MCHLQLALKHFVCVVYVCAYSNRLLCLTIHLCLCYSLPFIDTLSIAVVDNYVLLLV